MTNENALWEKLYALSDEFFAMKPWEILEEMDVFGIHCPESGRDYFISIMGSLGKSFSLSAYEGSSGLYKFWHLQSDKEELQPFYLLSIPFMLVSLDEPEIIDKFQLDIMKSLGMKTKKSLPHISKNVPGFIPRTPEKDDLTDFVHILRESIIVVKRAKTNIEFIHSDDDHDEDYFFRTAALCDDKWIWRDTKRRVEEPRKEIEIKYNRSTFDTFLSLPINRNIIQMDLQIFPTPVRDKDNPPYFPSLLLMADEKTGIILMYEFIPPFPDYNSMINSLPSVVMKKFIEYGKRPARLKFRSPDLERACYFLEKKAGINCWQSYKLKAFDEAFAALLNNLRK